MITNWSKPKQPVAEFLTETMQQAAVSGKDIPFVKARPGQTAEGGINSVLDGLSNHLWWCQASVERAFQPASKGQLEAESLKLIARTASF